MNEASTTAGKITVEELKGLNERDQFANQDIGMFDLLQGAIPSNRNTLTKMNGCKLHLEFGEPILNFVQTNDSRGNIIIQTPTAIRVVTEEELFNQVTPPTNLVVVAGNEEETMSRAIVVHQLAQGTNGGTYTTANTWQQAPLSAILSQLNPDGTAAAFVTFGSNQITLATGVYRIRAWSNMANAVANVRMAARLYNVTTASPAWAGFANEVSNGVVSAALNNMVLEFGGDLTLVAPTTFEVQGLASTAQANTGFGVPTYKVSAPVMTNMPRELYRWIEILKTA